MLKFAKKSAASLCLAATVDFSFRFCHAESENAALTKPQKER